jgi:hypothetical protein
MSDASSTRGDLGFSPTVRWAGPATNKKRPEFTGETFNAIREKSNAERAAVVQQTGKTPAEQLYSEMWGNRLFPLDAVKFLVRQFSALIEKTNKLEAQVKELQVQLSLVRGLPPFMKNVEHRG